MPDRSERRLRAGLVASALHRSGPGAALFRLALKRECVIHETSFISTFAHAREWFELARIAHGYARDPALDPLLERSARIATARTMCISDRASAQRWIRNCEQRAAAT